MGKFGSAVKNAGEGLNWLFVIGFLGVVWFMIYGNLSGNLGFTTVQSSYINETITLNASSTPANAQGLVNGVINPYSMVNATGGETVPLSNYTVNGVIISNLTSTYAGQPVNISYTVTYDSIGKINTDVVIRNLTDGGKAFYGLSPVLFKIIGIVLLITILLSLLYVVMKIVDMGKNKGTYSQSSY